jgi:prepilin-type N-terminal cleavage/methylation domain-containing protein
MKNKGFTLIELMATIIVLSVVATIAIPIITNLINDSRKSSLLTSVNNLVKTAEIMYVESYEDGYSSVYQDGVITSGEVLNFRGKIPSFLAINVNYLGQVSLYAWEDSLNICVIKNYNDDVPIVDEEMQKEDCISLSGVIIVSLYNQVTDSNPGIICSNTLIEDYVNTSICNINSIEDLVQLSELTKTVNFSGKTVILNENLDFENDKSYINPNTTIFGDINGNGTIENLKTELTTGAGFLPIGTSVRPFAGIFDGNSKILNNLFINRTTINTGMFGVLSAGTIKGITLNNVNVTGRDRTGGLLGFGSGTVSSAIVKGNVTGLIGTGGVIGRSTSSTPILSASQLIFEGNVVGTSEVAGVFGYIDSWSIIANGLYNIGGSVTGTNNTFRVSGPYAPTNAISNANVLLNGSLVADGSAWTTLNGLNGLNVSNSSLNDLNILESSGMDTYVGGDNNLDGYYFDHDSSGNIIIKPASTITITMAGTGTLLDPYQIGNLAQLKEASINPSAHYILINDINVNNENIHMLSSNYNRFSGSFNGNNRTISNININGQAFSGLFGYVLSGSTIRDINFANVNITGRERTGLIGYMGNSLLENININGLQINGFDYAGLVGDLVSGTIKGITLNNINVTGRNRTGGLLGGGSGTVSSAIVKGNVTGLIGTGGVIGRSTSSTPILNASQLIFEGNVVGTEQVAGVYGYRESTSGTMNGFYNMGGSVTGSSSHGYRVAGPYAPTAASSNENVLVNGSLILPTHGFANINSLHGRNVTESDKHNITVLNNNGLDTVIGGDNDSDGYYFDFVSGTGIVIIKQ